MKLEYNLENIGNIDKASITIKPLTIIAGKNSSGKTFVTKSLYTVLNSVYQNHFFNQIFSIYDDINYFYEIFIDIVKEPTSIDLIFENLFFDMSREVSSVLFLLEDCNFEEEEDIITNNMDIFINFKEEIVHYLNERKKLKKFQVYKKQINTLLLSCDIFIETLENRKKIVIDSIGKSLEVGLKKNYQIIDLKSLIKLGGNKKLKLILKDIGKIEIDSKSKLDFDFKGQGIEQVRKVQNIVFFDSPIYIKIRKALQKNPSPYLNYDGRQDNDKYLKGYPEYLDTLYKFIDKEYIETSDFNDISQEIQEMISGKLNVTKSGDIQYVDNDNNTMSLSLTAMGISNIGLIDLLLRNNIINKGSFLIMDEPEVHLHPEWQVLLAQLLYKIAKSGANIILATHSLDFLKAFENILKEENEIAEDIIAINKMPYDKTFSELSELKKVGIVLDDLSKPFYDLYMQDI